MTESWNSDVPPPAKDAADDDWPSFEDALRAHGFDVAPPTLDPQTQTEHETPKPLAMQPPVASATPDTAADAGRAAEASDEGNEWDIDRALGSSAPEPVTADDDADAPVLPDVESAAPSWEEETVEVADDGPSTWGEATVPADASDRWWLEPPDEHSAAAASVGADVETAPGTPTDPAPAPVAEVEQAAPAEPPAEPPAVAPRATEPAPFTWEADEPAASATDGWPTDSAWTSDAAVNPPDAATTTEGWSADETWASDQVVPQPSVEPSVPAAAPASHAANTPRTLPDQRPPTPPASLFARRGASAAPTASAAEMPLPTPVAETTPTSVPPAGREDFTPWAFEPPAPVDVPATAEPAAALAVPISAEPIDEAVEPPAAASPWAEPADPWAAPAAEAAPVGAEPDAASAAHFWIAPSLPVMGAGDAAAVDDNWASPEFVPAPGAPAIEVAAAESVTAPDVDDGGPTPSVDWYEAAALEVVGTSKADASDTEFIGYEDGAPSVGETAEPIADDATVPAPADAEAHEDPPEPAATPAETPAETTVESSQGAMNQPIGDDPWASPAFLNRIPETAPDPYAMETSAQQREDASAEVAAEAAPVEAAPDAWADYKEAEWPAPSVDAWPKSSDEGWPEFGGASAWSVAAAPEGDRAEATADAALAADVEHTAVAAEPAQADEAVASEEPAGEATPTTADVETSPLVEETEPASSDESAPAADGTPAPEPVGEAAVGAAADAAPVDGVFSRYAAAAGVRDKPAPSSRKSKAAARASADAAAAATVAATADPGATASDLWKLVADSSALPVPAPATDKRSFDPVSIFLTVLVAVVIVALLLGFLVFAGGLLGH